MQTVNVALSAALCWLADTIIKESMYIRTYCRIGEFTNKFGQKGQGIQLANNVHSISR